MWAATLITLREGVEAFLIVGILLGYLAKMGLRQYGRQVWTGALAAGAVSLALGVIMQRLAIELEGKAEEIFELVVSLVAVGVLTYMVLWMQKQSRSIKSDLEQRMSAAVSGNQLWALAVLAFISVFREGLETALFLVATATEAHGGAVLGGALIGLALAALLVYAIFKATVRLNLRSFFVATGVLVIFIGAGMMGHSAEALGELGILPEMIEHVWNTNGIIAETSLAGRMLHAFVGYEPTPSLLWVIFYFGYLLVFGYLFWRGLFGGSGSRQEVRAHMA